MFADHFKKSLILNSAFIFGSFLCAAIALYFLSNFTADKVQAVQNSRKANAQYVIDTNALTYLKAEKADAEKLKPALAALLPREDQLYDFTPWLNQRGIAHHLTLDFKFNDSQNNAVPPKPSSIPFRLVAIGAKEDVLSFLRDLETQSQGGYLIGIDSVDFSKVNEGYRAAMPGQLFFIKKAAKTTQ